jgi:hypothetical protein
VAILRANRRVLFGVFLRLLWPRRGPRFWAESDPGQTPARPIFDGRASLLTALRPQTPAVWSCKCYDNSNVTLVSDPAYGQVYRYYTDDASTNHGGYDPGPLAGVSELTWAVTGWSRHSGSSFGLDRLIEDGGLRGAVRLLAHPRLRPQVERERVSRGAGAD